MLFYFVELKVRNIFFCLFDFSIPLISIFHLKVFQSRGISKGKLKSSQTPIPAHKSLAHNFIQKARFNQMKHRYQLFTLFHLISLRNVS